MAFLLQTLAFSLHFIMLELGLCKSRLEFDNWLYVRLWHEGALEGVCKARAEEGTGARLFASFLHHAPNTVSLWLQPLRWLWPNPLRSFPNTQRTRFTVPHLTDASPQPASVSSSGVQVLHQSFVSELRHQPNPLLSSEFQLHKALPLISNFQ